MTWANVDIQFHTIPLLFWWCWFGVVESPFCRLHCSCLLPRVNLDRTRGKFNCPSTLQQPRILDPESTHPRIWQGWVLLQIRVRPQINLPSVSGYHKWSKQCVQHKSAAPSCWWSNQKKKREKQAASLSKFFKVLVVKAFAREATFLPTLFKVFSSCPSRVGFHWIASKRCASSDTSSAESSLSQIITNLTVSFSQW